jgi:sulfite reductase (NADPH) flavoprotein alpha-component
VALSQIKDKMYVQDILMQQQKDVVKTLKDGGVFMLCGSIAMQHSVLDTLEEIARTNLQQPLSDFENNGQLLMDCY